MPTDGSAQCNVIKGGISVRIGAEDSADDIKSLVRSIAENAMTTDQLISAGVPALIKVTYVGEIADADPDKGGAPEEESSVIGGATDKQSPVAKSTSMTAVIALGSSFAALALFVGVFFLRNRQKEETEDDDDDDDSLFGTTVFSGVDSKHSPVDSAQSPSGDFFTVRLDKISEQGTDDEESKN